VTLANRITLFRLFLVPVFAGLIISYRAEYPWIRYTALGVYISAAISDALDGFVARAYNQKTKLGTVLDPLADKLMINIGFVFMAANPEFGAHIPYWFPVVILLRDAMIVIGAYLINEYYGPVRVRPKISGKLTTVFLMSLMIAVLLNLWFAKHIMYASLVLLAISYFDYMREGIRQIGNEDES
jgi:CDP-diacylglycerol--glycerol-3-phosphate 3-phosphatidyltransferase